MSHVISSSSLCDLCHTQTVPLLFIVHYRLKHELYALLYVWSEKVLAVLLQIVYIVQAYIYL